MVVLEQAYETLRLEFPSKGVLHVILNRPDKRNAINERMWREIGALFGGLHLEPSVRCVVLTAAGRMFTSGLDLKESASGFGDPRDVDPSRRNFTVLHFVRQFQQAFTNIERCPQPVICAVHSACIGGGVDLACACDIRLATRDARFSIKEVDIGLAADVGTLQRLPKIVGNEGLVRELAYTGRWWGAEEALQAGFVNRLYDSVEDLCQASLKLAAEIASKSPVAVFGTKYHLVYSRDHGVADALEHIAVWNMATLGSADVKEAVTSFLGKKTPQFKDLPNLQFKSKL